VGLLFSLVAKSSFFMQNYVMVNGTLDKDKASRRLKSELQGANAPGDHLHGRYTRLRRQTISVADAPQARFQSPAFVLCRIHVNFTLFSHKRPLSCDIMGATNRSGRAEGTILRVEKGGQREKKTESEHQHLVSNHEL
jgi:hypothetical protein